MATDCSTALVEQWRASGVVPGSVLLVHSNIKRTLMTCRRLGWMIRPADILDSFLTALGPDGTLLLPLFNFDFARGVPFDIRTTPSQMGALTEAGRVHPDAVRTGHPIYSFAAIGAQAGRFRGVDNVSGYAEDSPFGMLRDMDGIIGVLDLEDQDSMTFYHHVEEVKRVPYRYFKDFTGLYTDASGRTMTRTYTLYVRNVEQGVVTDVNPAGELMWQHGLYKGYRPRTGSGFRTVSARAMFRFVADIIDGSRALGTLYSVRRS